MKNNLINNTQYSPESRHVEAIRDLKIARQTISKAACNSSYDGLANLQKLTVSLMSSESKNWGFANLPFSVLRQKLSDNIWKITVKNPKTREIILEAEGSSDKIFAYEDNLARMATALADKDLKITAHINK